MCSRRSPVDELTGRRRQLATQIGQGMTPRALHAFLEREAGNLRETLGKVEAQILRETLQRYGTQSKAARHLGVAQATIARKTKRYGL